MAYTISEDCIGCRACSNLCPTGAITGEKKEVHTILGDLCIECGACGRVCPSGAVLDPFGLALKRLPKKEWNQPRFDLVKCMSCAICTDTCPTAAISQSLLRKKNPHLFPFLADETLCIGCGFCSFDCPADAIEMVNARAAETAEG